LLSVVFSVRLEGGVIRPTGRWGWSESLHFVE
jgi:hypothetical protein